jgi:hypothetical protein
VFSSAVMPSFSNVSGVSSSYIPWTVSCTDAMTDLPETLKAVPENAP